jgi:xylose isomerase
MTMTTEERAWKAQFLEQQERQTAALEEIARSLNMISRCFWPDDVAPGGAVIGSFRVRDTSGDWKK